MASVLGGLLLAQGVSSGMAQDFERGRKASGQCRTCHGNDGYATIPIAPHIGGEPAQYLAEQLKAFREGTREHEMMTVVAKGLTDETISDLAAFYSAHGAAATLPAGASEEDAPELCTACHGANGISLVDDAPNLAGESALYIDTQLKAFRSGKRQNDVMTPLASDLTDDEIRTLADWYASAKLEITKPDQ